MRRSGRPLATLARVTGAAALAWPAVASAHAGGGGFILLLPTHLYLAGGALVVAASFGLVAAAPPRLLARLETLSGRLGVRVPPGLDALSVATSLLSLAAVALLVTAGLLGSRDPLANPLPLLVWTAWWIGFTALQAAVGNLWIHLNPWTGLYRLATSAGPLRPWREEPPFTYPGVLGQWPAVAGYLAFAWFELVYPAPADPAVLAMAVAVYVLAHFAGLLAFGPTWLEAAESFGVLFGVVSRLAPVRVSRPDPSVAARERRLEVEVTLPSLGLLRAGTPRVSLAAFVILVLSTVSFDGLSRTFAWLGLLGENPLAYPGRSVLLVSNTLGLLGLAAGLGLGYAATVRLTASAGDWHLPFGQMVGLFALPLVPIACGYHFAHYLPVFLVDIQYAIRAVSDPMARGWDLLGTADRPVVTSLLSDPERVYAVWHAQVALIVAAHVAGITLAHVLAVRHLGRARAVLSQLPMLILMIGYTLLGLWLLSTPSVG